MTAYYMDGRHKTKIHIKVKTTMGSVAWCGTDSRYSKDVMGAEAFRELPVEKQCKRCRRALQSPPAKVDHQVGTPPPAPSPAPAPAAGPD